MFDPTLWHARLGAILGRVCRIEIDGSSGGTAFLIGSDLILTSHHVLADVFSGRRPLAAVSARFDEHHVAPGPTATGTVIGVRHVVDASPLGPVDLLDAPPELSSRDQLGFALLQLDRAVGDAAIGESPEPGAPRRGWLVVGRANFQSGSPLFIVHYPRAGPLSLSLDTDAILGVNALGTRVRYRSSTGPGSSGSPCFDQAWNLVALHQGGSMSFNQGVPIGAIAERLRKFATFEFQSTP